MQQERVPISEVERIVGEYVVRSISDLKGFLHT
jgi:hypothetical protein